MDGLIDRLASHLAPLFVTSTHDLPAARLTAVRTIASYQPETQGDFINITRSIAFSMSALAALRRAAAQEMPPALQLRYFGSANSLNRSADQSERTMERRRRYQQARTSPMPQAWTGVQGADIAAGTAAVTPETGDRARQEIGDARLADHGTCDPGIVDAEMAELEVGEAAIEAAVAEAMLKYTIGCKPGSAVAVAAANPLLRAASMLHRGVKGDLGSVFQIRQGIMPGKSESRISVGIPSHSAGRGNSRHNHGTLGVPRAEPREAREGS